jgi:hypothetical protein
VRRFNYYRSPGPNFAHNFRNHDLRQQVSDFSLKLFPQRAVRINAGDRLTKWTSYWNTLSLDMNFGRKFSANLGWRAMRRDVTLDGLFTSRTSTSSTVSTLVDDESESVDTHAFVGGFRVRPSERFSFIFDVDHGTSNNAFVRINPLEYTR